MAKKKPIVLAPGVYFRETSLSQHITNLMPGWRDALLEMQIEDAAREFEGLPPINRSHGIPLTMEFSCDEVKQDG